MNSVQKNNQTSTIHRMQSPQSISSVCSETKVFGQISGQYGIGTSFLEESMITITEIALKKMVELKEKMKLPVKGLRVGATPRSPLRANFSIRFVPAEEKDDPTDIIQSFDGIDIYIASDSAPYLEGATIDFVFSLISSEFKVEAPLRKLDTPEGRVAVKIQQVLNEETNPSLSTHGGGATLIDYKDGIVFIELTGGCQGCSMAGATMKDGIETSIRQSVPEVMEVRDITSHANGKNPYFQG